MIYGEDLKKVLYSTLFVFLHIRLDHYLSFFTSLTDVCMVV